MPKRSDIDPNFQAQVKNLATLQSDEYDARTKGNQVKVDMPVKNDWDGDLHDLDGIGQAFNRDKANEDFTNAIKDPNNPGVTGDLVATTTQIDYLSCMERAFRARHGSSFPRMVAQAAGRANNQGADTGPIVRSALDYVRGVHKQSG
jgi:hypothetical protein